MSGADQMDQGEADGLESHEPGRSAPLAPPTQGEPLPTRRTSWPTVVGVIGIIYSSMGFLGAFCGLAYPWILPWYVDFLRSVGVSEQEVQEMETSMPPVGWMVISSVIGLALVILLFAGALKLLRRQVLGARLCRLWAWTIIPWTIIATMVTLVIQLSAPVPSGGPGQKIGTAIMTVAGVLVGLVLPVFMVIWFSRPTIKSQVAQWRRRSDETSLGVSYGAK